MKPAGDHFHFQSPDSSFASTQWSLVVRAGQSDVEEAHVALAKLCGRYWYPLYAFVRNRVVDLHEAQDLTQAFFAFLLEKNVLARASPDRGRFRSFLLSSIKNFLANERDRARALKRGGGLKHLSLDLTAAESRLGIEPAHHVTPEHIFERHWALTLLDIVMTKLRSEFAAAGKARQFELLKDTLTGGKERSFAAIAKELSMSEDAARQAAQRLRKRYRELLREEVAHTVADPKDVDEEIRGLFEALGN